MEIYNENIVYYNSSHAIEYEAEDAENSTELFKTRDMMKVFLELSSSAKNSDDAMYKIIRYVAEKFDIDWFQIMKVLSLIHIYPGMTVKGSANYVTYLALSFEETINHMQHKEKCVVTGNPIRSEILYSDYKKSREKLGIKKPFVLIFGGSLGADRINDTVIGMLDRISKDNKIELLFGTGDRNYDKIMNKIKAVSYTHLDVYKRQCKG